MSDIANAPVQPVTTTTILGFTPAQIVSGIDAIVEIVGAVSNPAATVAGFTIDQIAKLAVGVVNQVPAAIDAVQQITDLAKSGQAPTAEQWAAWNAAADQAHAEAQAALDAVIAKG